ncbi:hypothetical protein QYF61_025505 [Mycteria americana]|uniref:Uncharacterized protein n=1 Tax=Mycteria americana TaxID=33587 RepID=A0AAN7MWB6_MYCAM|nr:hypothetical protein QYF61_025505 [Mycteria americana]
MPRYRTTKRKAKLHCMITLSKPVSNHKSQSNFCPTPPVADTGTYRISTTPSLFPQPPPHAGAAASLVTQGTPLTTALPSHAKTNSYLEQEAESFRLEKTFKIVINLALPSPPLNHVPKHLSQTAFKYLQGWGLNHFPGQPVPVLDNPFSEVKFPDTQSKPPLAQVEAISSHPMACYLGEETNPTSLHPPFSDEVSPQPPFLQAKQPQVPQPLPISLVLQTLPQLRCPSLDTLQPLNVSLGVRGPKLNTGFEVRPHQCRVQGHDHFPSPAGHTIPDTSQDAIGLLGHLGTPLAHIQAAVDQHSPRSFSAWQLSSHSAPSL